MTGTAIVMMLIAMLVLWGGLVGAIVHLNYSDRNTARKAREQS